MKINCSKCNLDWKTSPKNRTEGTICPYCLGKKAIPGRTSFKALYPELAEKQSNINEIDLDSILPSYTIDLSWYCSNCNLEWKASPKDRSDGVKCPYCSGKKAIPGRTSFKALYPALMKEWKKINYIHVDANLVTEIYSKSVWWKCPKCNTSYEMSPKTRAIYYKRNQESCGYCKGYRRSKKHIL